MPDITIDLDGAATGSTAQALENIIEAAESDHEGTGSAGSSADSFADQIVPMVLFLAVALTYCTKYYFAHRTRQDLQSTVRSALERGQPLTPELLDRLGQTSPPKRTDLRRGVIGVGLGIGIGAFGLVIGEPDAVRPMLAVGLVPLLLGLAYLVLWRLHGDKA